MSNSIPPLGSATATVMICWLVLDASTSMTGKRATELNNGLAYLKQQLSSHTQLSAKIRIGIISFGDDSKILCPLSSPDKLIPPTIVPTGSTRMAKGLNMALETIEVLSKDEEAWIILITDGVPNYDEDIQSLVDRLEPLYAEHKLKLIAIGVNGGDHSVLKELAPDHIPPYRLLNLRFNKLFDWLVALWDAPDQYPDHLPEAVGWSTHEINQNYRSH